MADKAGRFILLDRDGVLNEDLAESVRSESDFVLLPDVPEAVAKLYRKGYRILVATNQACVGRGELSFDELHRIHEAMLRDVRAAGGDIERIYVCPHTADDGCDCRKPRPGLLMRARLDFGFEPSQTWMIGDSGRDVEAARSAGVRPALVQSDRNPAYRAAEGIPVFDDLMHFAREISAII